jgi:ABC-2 type transport system ATP-binding protein
MTPTTVEATVTHAHHAGAPPSISVTGVTRLYRGQRALDDVSFDVEAGSITGLLGRNGAGKTTLMRIIAGHEFTSAGHVTVGGASPVENEAVLRQMVFLREDQAYPDVKAAHMLRAASKLYPDWDAGFAAELVADFGLPLNRRIRKLSRGQRSAVGIVIALAARARVTLLDEPYAGLDATARQLFYDRLLADFTDHPRTVLLSTHLIDEASPLMERVVVLDGGRLGLSASADDLRGSAATVSGPAIAVTEFTAGRMVWSRRRVGSQESAIVAGPLADGDAARARGLRLSLEPLSLQQVVVQAAGQSETPATTESSERTTA